MYIQFNITLTVKHVHVVISIQQPPVLKEQRKSKGLGILPYGTPKLVSAKLDSVPLTLTNCFLLSKYD
jgi:hypothetical protein